MKEPSIQISSQEFRARAKQLLEHLQAQNLSGIVLFDSNYIHYYAGFAFIPTERPMAYAISATGESALFVPRLELEHAQAKGVVDRVDHYLEYPSNPHPMDSFADTLKAMGVTGEAGPIGIDSDGYPWIMGYQGPRLSDFMGAEVMSVIAFVEAQMAHKSQAELALIRESCKWGNLAHRLLQKYTKVGVTETEVSMRASQEATLALIETLGSLYRAQSMFSPGAEANYRGQIGRNAAIPHALTTNASFLPGDVLVTGAGAAMWGYHSELERTMIMGEPSEEQRTFFEHMKTAQEVALEAMRPGVKCSEVDQAVRDYYDENDLMPYWKHHTGHAIGLRYHEGPFLDTGDHTILQQGMVFTVEPGLYVEGLGGFRHSDTVAITDDGIDFLTYYPRDLASLTIPI